MVSLSIAVSMILCSFTMIALDKARKNDMIIAVLGKGNNASVVISYDGKTDIIDLSGHYRSAEYVKKYLSENGISHINMLILTKKSASQDLNYETALGFSKINRRFAVNDIQIYSDRLELLGNSRFSMDSGSYIIEYDFFTIKFSKGKISIVTYSRFYYQFCHFLNACNISTKNIINSAQFTLFQNRSQ